MTADWDRDLDREWNLEEAARREAPPAVIGRIKCGQLWAELGSRG